MKRTALLLAGAVALATATIQPSNAVDTAAEAERPIRLTRGHIDLFEVTYSAASGGLVLNVKDDSHLYSSTASFRRPADVSVEVDQTIARIELPELGPEWSFLGEPGDVRWYLPEVQEPDLPWPGWSSQRLEGTLPEGTSLAETDPVKLAVAVDGPGDVFAFMTDPGGMPINKYVDTDDPAADIIPMTSNTHAHTNWFFTQPGDYTLTVTPSATTSTGGTINGTAADYLVRVRPQNPAVLPGLGPVTSGTARVGQKLTATTGTWSASRLTYKYQWLRNGVAISGATSSSRTLTSHDHGKKLSVRVTATGAAGTTPGVATSAAKTIALGYAPRNTVKPTVTGRHRVGSLETAYPGSWSPSATSYRYQWYRGTTKIAGATKRTYRPTRADKWRTIKVVVTALRSGHSSGRATSAGVQITPARS
jgi:surface-anchored protein